MNEKFNNRYRIKSARASWWNYGWNGAYFITICTKNREDFFGKITNEGNMECNAIGDWATSCWFEIPKHFPFVELGEFVVMPNHVHGIIIINKPNHFVDDDAPLITRPIVETQNFASLQLGAEQSSSSSKNKFGPQSQNLASIVRGYKIGVTKQARLINPDFCWQPRYHDHIIRNKQEYERISEYIINNPKNGFGIHSTIDNFSI